MTRLQAALVVNPKAKEFAGGRRIGGLNIVDIIAHLLVNCGDKSRAVGVLAFDDQFHPSIWQVADKTDNVVVAGDLHGCVAETDALDMTAEITGGTANHGDNVVAIRSIENPRVDRPSHA